MASKNEKVNQALEEIAQAGIQLTQKPGTKTKENIQTIINHCKNYKNHKIQRMAVMSLAQVFIDVLPSYKVDKHSDKDRPSAEVKARRAYESQLLESSRQFIQIAEKIAYGSHNPTANRVAAAKALSGIYVSKPAFNTGDILAGTVVRLACSNNERVRQVTCAQINDLFLHDPNGKSTLDVISKISSTPTTQISTEILQTLMSIKFKDIPQKTAAEAEKEKNEKITDKELLKDLKEADVITDNSEAERTQIAILEHLFATVFRFLKETRSELHFIAAMDIVRKYVKRINIDYVAPIISALKQSRFSLRAAITAAQTALVLCETCEYTVDLREYFKEVYARAYEAIEDRDAILDFMALFEEISRSIDSARTASFAKRLMIMSIHAPSDIAATILTYMRKLIPDQLKLTGAVDFEFEAEGEFNLHGTDPDFVNGPAAKWWELAILTHHRHAIVRELAEELTTLVDSDAVREASIRAAKEKKVYNPRTTLEECDDSERVFDTRLLEVNPAKRPKKWKVYNLI